MSLPSFPSLTLRADKGSQLTHTELDNNFKFTRSYVEMLASLFGVTLNADGTLNADTVDTLQLKDRSVTEAKLGPVSVFPLKEDTGPTNSLRIAFTPPLTAYADGQIFHIITDNACTGPATLQVDAIANPVEVVKNGSVELSKDDYKAGLLVLGYFNSKFHLLSSTAASDSESTGGFSGFKVFEPADVAIPTDATSELFSHGLGVTPSEYSAHLICIDNDLGFIVGDVVPLDNLTDGGGNPAFAVSVNTVTLKVERDAVGIEIAGLGGIDTAKWNLRVRASVKTSTATVLFPATEILSRYPQGVYGNGNDVFIINKGIDGTVHTSRIDLATNNVTRLTPASSGPNHLKCNCSGIKLADGTLEMIFMSQQGIYHMPLLPAVPWQIEQLTSLATSYYTHKVVWHTESSGINKVYAVPSNYGSTFRINSMPLREITISSGAVVDIGSNVNLCHASILSADGSPGNVEFIAFNPTPGGIMPMLFQYNKVKKRIYVMTNDTNYLHIFELVGTSGYTDPSSILEWWQDGSRYSRLQYKKTISVAGGGMNSTEADAENYVVDFDLVTGEERAILFNRNAQATVAGAISRIPWKE